MRIAVSGATGTIGRAFVKAACAKGHDVLPLVRDGPPSGMDLPCATIDLLSEPCCDSKALRGVDTLVHLAAAVIVDPQDRAEAERLWQINVLGTGALITAMEKQGVDHLVIASTANLYDPASGIADEDSAVRADRRSLYLGSKAAQEFVAAERCRVAGIAHATIRISSVVQTGDDIFSRIVRNVGLGQPAGIKSPSYGADFVALDDVVSGLLLACQAKLNGVFNLGSGRRVTLGELEMIALGKVNGITPDLPGDPGPGGENGYAAVDCTKLAAFGYRPTPIEQIVANVMKDASQECNALAV